jgi:hypothetical protein
MAVTDYGSSTKKRPKSSTLPVASGTIDDPSASGAAESEILYVRPTSQFPRVRSTWHCFVLAVVEPVAAAAAVVAASCGPGNENDLPPFGAVGVLAAAGAPWFSTTSSSAGYASGFSHHLIMELLHFLFNFFALAYCASGIVQKPSCLPI